MTLWEQAVKMVYWWFCLLRLLLGSSNAFTVNESVCQELCFSLMKLMHNVVRDLGFEDLSRSLVTQQGAGGACI